MSPSWMTSAQAAAALGVKPASLYAYVSRGVITRHVAVVAGRRVSLFDREDVLALVAQRTRPRSGSLSVLLESDVTQLDADGALAFRGVPVAVCAGWGFERTGRHVLGDHPHGDPRAGGVTPEAGPPVESPATSTARAGTDGVGPTHVGAARIDTAGIGTAGGGPDVIRRVVLDLAGRDPDRASIDRKSVV